MRKEIELKNEKIVYTLRRNRRAKNLRLLVYPGGELAVSAPRYLSGNEIEGFILEKADWVVEKIEAMKKHARDKVFGARSKEEYMQLKNEARQVAQKKLEYFNAYYGFQYEKLTIRNQKTRWGSCSTNGTLSYNYKIAILPEKFSNYIVVHELCHLREFNHSERFWKLVARTIPDYKEIRSELRRK